MRIPDKIKIGGFTVSIEESRNLIADRQELGNYTPRTQTIALDSDCTDQQKEETLLHEILEAIVAIYDIKLDHHVLSLLATVLHQVLKDNELSFR